MLYVHLEYHFDSFVHHASVCLVTRWTQVIYVAIRIKEDEEIQWLQLLLVWPEATRVSGRAN